MLDAITHVGDSVILWLTVSTVAVPAAYVALGSALGRRVIELSAAVPLSFALSLLTLFLALAGWTGDAVSTFPALPATLVSGALIALPLLGERARRARGAPVEAGRDRVRPRRGGGEPSGEGVDENKSEGESACLPAIIAKIGDDDVNRNKDDMIFNPRRSNFLPTTIYAYRWTVTFDSTPTSLEVTADLVGYIYPWYKLGLGEYIGPFQATSRGSATILCRKVGGKCAALASNTSPNTAIKAEFSSGVVVNAKSAGDSVTVEAAAVVALKGNVAVSGATIGSTAGSANVGVTLTVPNTALDSETYNQSLIFTCSTAPAQASRGRLASRPATD